MTTRRASKCQLSTQKFITMKNAIVFEIFHSCLLGGCEGENLSWGLIGQEKCLVRARLKNCMKWKPGGPYFQDYFDFLAVSNDA